MIGQVREARFLGLDPEAHGWPGMHDEIRGQRCAVYRPRLPWNVVESHSSRDLAEADREERRREGTRDALAETQERRGRSPDVEREPLVPERREEAESLEVVEVEVGQEEMNAARAAVQELEAEIPDSGASVEHEESPIVERDLDA